METCRAALVSGARGDAWSHGHLYHPHFHVRLIVPAEYFEPGSLLYVGQAEWRLMWEQCLSAAGRRIVDMRVTENSGEVAKYVTKPGAYLKLDGAGAWWCDPERLETVHYALGRGASSAGRGRCLESDVSSGSWKPRTSTIWLPSTNLTTARRGCRSERFCTACTATRRAGSPITCR